MSKWNEINEGMNKWKTLKEEKWMNYIKWK